MFKKVMLATTAIVFSASAMASGVGFIDMEQVAKKSYSFQKLQKSIKSKFEPRQKTIIKLQKEFQDEQAKLIKDQAVMSKSAVNKAAGKLQKKAKHLQELQGSYQKDFIAQQNSATEKFLNQVRKAARKVALDAKLDAILPTNAAVFMASSTDYTKQVIKKLND